MSRGPVEGEKMLLVAFSRLSELLEVCAYA